MIRSDHWKARGQTLQGEGKALESRQRCLVAVLHRILSEPQY